MIPPDMCQISFEATLEAAITMIDDVFSQYIDALYRVKSPQSKTLLHDEAQATLKRKHSLELALLNGHINTELQQEYIPTMNLDYALHQQSLTEDADTREVLAFAIHLEKIAEVYFHRMCENCSQAASSVLLQRLRQEQNKRLLSLEDLYELHFLTEN